MLRYLLDTNILVHLIRGKAIGTQINNTYGLTTTKQVPLICVVTEGEIKAFGKKLGWGVGKVNEIARLVGYFPIIQLDFAHITDTYAEIDSYSTSIGRRMGKNDLWIAAAAKETDTTLLTTDGDFDHLGGLLKLEKFVV